MTIAHTVVAQACLGILLHLDKGVRSFNLTDFPLAKYAAKHCMDHAKFENVSSHMQDGIKRLFDPSKHHFSVWFRISDPYSSLSLRSPAASVPLHYASLIGLHDVVVFLIDKHPQYINARVNQEKPLHSASRGGHTVIVQLLLENGANVMSTARHARTPLHLASMYGHREVARILLKHGAEVNAMDLQKIGITSRSGQPLYGHPTIITRSTPLHLALDDGVARVLLEHGADRSNRRMEYSYGGGKTVFP